jgi:hypothetical protein
MDSAFTWRYADHTKLDNKPRKNGEEKRGGNGMEGYGEGNGMEGYGKEGNAIIRAEY